MAPLNPHLPVRDQIFLDHVGHFVRDPNIAKAALERVGFNPTPISIQVSPRRDGNPEQLTGTGNLTAMLGQGYIEVLFKTAETALGQEFDAALERYAGIHLVALAVADASDTHQRLAHDFEVRPLVEMQRPVDTGHGPGTVAFTVARLARGVMPEGRIQFLTHRTPETMWQPRWLPHPNGAEALTDVVIAVSDVSEAAGRYARLTGRSATHTDYGRRVILDRGEIHLLDRNAFHALFKAVKIPSLPFIGVYGIRVRSLAEAEAMMRLRNISTERKPRCVIACFPAELGIGAWCFVESAGDLPWRRL
ncbi:MAG: VOC family protein [Beijerinckiaceae bacterium]